MLEYLFIFVLTLIAILWVRNNSLVRHYQNYRRERDDLEKKYNRLFKARNDLLVSPLF